MLWLTIEIIFKATMPFDRDDWCGFKFASRYTSAASMSTMRADMINDCITGK